MALDSDALRALAARLRDAHRPGDPLVLPNAWDAVTARAVAGAGFAAVATSSGAVARMLGVADDNSIDAGDVFAVIGRVAGTVEIPVTADIVAGFDLQPGELVERLLAAGAVGCNLEDTDHATHALADPGAQADWIAAVKAAARTTGVDIVLNARVDAFIRAEDHAAALDDAITRAHAYRAAGADCVYPIVLADDALIAAFVAAVECPVNVLLRPGVPSLARLRALGLARASMGSGLQHIALDAVNGALARLAVGELPWDAA
jgi:2-methylisocitrate lyase-like PEP mutase family enzyme